MTLTPKELRRYLSPILRRKSFRFHRLDGLIDDEKRRVIALAKAFCVPGQPDRFMRSLKAAPEALRLAVNAEIDKSLSAGLTNGAGHRGRLALMRSIQGHLISHGIYADFGRPSSVGLIISRSSVGHLPVYFLLTESCSSTSAFCGRLTMASDGTGHMAIHVTDTGARLAEILDMWLCSPRGNDDGMFERRLVRTPAEDLERWCSGISLHPEEFPVQTAIFIISMRAAIERLRVLARSVDSPEEFLMRALNMQLDSVLAHETAHALEHEANGAIAIGKEAKEIIAYLLEAVHSAPEDAFLSLLNRHFSFSTIMPAMERDLRIKGVSSFLETPRSLARWALEALDGIFIRYTGRRHGEVIDPARIRAVQSTDFIRPQDMPLLEKALFNPSNSGRDSAG